MRKTLEHAREIGTALLEVKRLCKAEGQSYLPWVQENCRVSISESQRYTRIADHWNELIEATKGKKLEDLSLTEALKILSRSGKEKKASQPCKLKVISSDDLA